MKSEHIIVDGVESKTCTTCGKTKPLAEFYRHRLTADGLCSVCKSCHMAANMRTRAMRRKFEEERKAIAAQKKPKKKKADGRVRKADGKARCAICKSYSRCTTTEGFCLRMKRSVGKNNVCDAIITNKKQEFQKEAHTVSVFSPTPYD